jgi:hypothetical protein
MMNIEVSVNFSSIILFLFFLSLSGISRAAIEIGADFGYDRKIYGPERENKIVNRTYSGSLALYFSTLTAIEFNYTYDDERAIDRTETSISGLNASIISTLTQINTVVYGVGLRQAFAPQASRFRPVISMGYARQAVESGSIYTIRNDQNQSTFEINGEVYKAQVDSVFMSFILQLRLTSGLSLNGSVYSVFEAFEWSEAKDDLRHKIGLSWIF